MPRLLCFLLCLPVGGVAGDTLRLRGVLEPIGVAPGALQEADGEVRVSARGHRLRLDLALRGVPEPAVVEIRGCAGDGAGLEVPNALLERVGDEARIVGATLMTDADLATLLRTGEACLDVHGASTSPYLRGRLKPWPAPRRAKTTEPADGPRLRDTLSPLRPAA